MPVVGIVPLVDDKLESLWMLPGYMDAVLEAGGVPIMLPLSRDYDVINAVAEKCDGFLFSGGHDVSPMLYNENKSDKCGKISFERDCEEQMLFDIALRDNKPVLGICRGIQLINVLLGGTLYQDLPSQRPTNVEHHQLPPYDIPIHRVDIVENSPLCKLLNVDKMMVNSYHHQAIKDLAKPLSAMAYSEDGLVEGVYVRDKKFVWAVQWHPEFSYKKDEKSRAIFKSFVDSCM